MTQYRTDLMDDVSPDDDLALNPPGEYDPTTDDGQTYYGESPDVPSYGE